MSGSASSSAASESRRATCRRCSRPERVCLCPYLPTHPIPTNTKIIILQHPHESRHKLSTTPLLSHCLSNLTVIVTRRLYPGFIPELLHQSPNSTCYLFPPSPSHPAVALSSLPHPPSLLIAFDATWRHANEMVRASQGYLGQFATRVCLDYYDEGVGGGTIYDSELVMRKEPYGGCVSTAEAVARALRVMEKARGEHVEERIVGVLREMVRLQAQFLKPVKARPKLGKKKLKRKDNEGVSEKSVGFGEESVTL